jgi:hypothetical protein
MVAQGAKEVLLADETYRLDPAQSLLVSVDLPVTARASSRRRQAVPTLRFASPWTPRSAANSSLTAGEVVRRYPVLRIIRVTVTR